MKVCRDCLVEMDCSEFYKRPSNSDGLYSYCKSCTAKRAVITREKYLEKRIEKNREYKRNNREALNLYSKEYYYKNRQSALLTVSKYREKNKKQISQKEALKRLMDPDRFEKNRALHKSWSDRNRDSINAYQRNWYRQNKEKRRCHVVLKRAIDKGFVNRPEKCMQCYRICKPDGHHDDYSKPLDVIWVCRKCHSRKSPRTVIKCLC